MDRSDTHDRSPWNTRRLLLYGPVALVGTLGVTVLVLYLVAVLPPSLPLFLLFLFVGLLAIVAAPSLIVVTLDTARDRMKRKWQRKQRTAYSDRVLDKIRRLVLLASPGDASS